jgi:hypothetical protein
LNRHLLTSTAAHSRLKPHPDCPRCAGRLRDELARDKPSWLRTKATVAAGVLALSSALPPSAAVATAPAAQQEETSTVPGEEPDFDPGGDDSFQTELDLPAGGDQNDDSEGPPLQSDPDTDPDVEVDAEAPPAPEPLPPPASAAPEPPPTGLPPTLTVPPVAPVPPSPAPPAAPTPATPVVPAPSEQRADNAPRADKVAERRTAERPDHLPPPAQAPTGAPAVPATSPVAQADPVVATSVAAPEPSGAAGAGTPPAGGRIAADSYRVVSGDSLWSIARRILGGEASNSQLAEEVTRLWVLNDQRIGTGDPDLLHVGTLLRLR